MSWDQEFYDPILMTGKPPLLTLRDAARFILKLPKAERALPESGDRRRVPMMVGERGGDPMVPRIAMMQALRRHGRHAPVAPKPKLEPQEPPLEPAYAQHAEPPALPPEEPPERPPPGPPMRLRVRRGRVTVRSRYLMQT